MFDLWRPFRKNVGEFFQRFVILDHWRDDRTNVHTILCKRI